MIYRGIKGVEGREPIGAVLRIGKKKDGAGRNRPPVDRDRFYVCLPKADASGGRPLDPRFKRYNTAVLEHRTTVTAALVHADAAECFSYHLQAWRLPSLQEPDRGAACAGDGENATRRIGERVQEIPCPHDRCEFRQGNSPACKPFGRVLFRPVWPDDWPLPTPLMVYETRSWNTISALVGMFNHVDTQARHLGVASPSLYGFPFQFQLSEETQPAKRRKYPVVRVTPLQDVQSFLLRQKATGLPVASMLEDEQHDSDVIDVSVKELSAPAEDGAG